MAANQPKSLQYVVRVGEFSPSETVLWDMFTADQMGQYMLAAQYDQIDASRRWLDDLKREAGLRWEREPTKGHMGVED